MKAQYNFSEEARDMLDQILVTAAREINADPASEQFIRDNIFGNITGILKPLLLRMLALGKLKPFEIDTFFKVLSYYCYSAATLNNSVFKVNVDEYKAAMAFIFSMITPAGD